MVAITVPLVGIVVISVIWYWFSPEYTDVGYQPQQPVAFSHKLHAGDLGMDCRYCHNTVERAAVAAVPPAATCMNCHTLVRKDSPKLALVRESFATGKPLRWKRVHLLPNYAYFNHSVHLASGVGCVECHGRIDQMEEVEQKKSLSMGFCLQCHRDPEPRLRPVEMITSMTYDAAAADYQPSKDPARRRMPTPPTNCSGCHR